MNDKEKLQSALEQWEGPTLEKVLDKTDERQNGFFAESGIPVKRLYVLEGVRRYVTIGEICGVMREKWGEFKAPIVDPTILMNS